MNEDKELNDFIKGKLEGDGEILRFGDIMRAAEEQSFALAAARRSRRRFLGASLLAASIAVICSFAVVSLQTAHDSPETTVAAAIDLLRTADGVEVVGEEASVAEMLLAFQDAPYDIAVSELYSAY